MTTPQKRKRGDGPGEPALNKRKARKGKQAAEADPLTTQAAQAALDQTLQQSHLAAASVKNYAGLIKHAKLWLANLQAADVPPSALGNLDTDNGNLDTDNDPEQLNSAPAEEESYSAIRDPDLKRGFDKPIRCTPYLIALYLNHLIRTKELSKSSLDAAYSAFSTYFGEMEEGHYKKGEWRLQEGSSNQYAGSPVHSFIVQRIIKILKREWPFNKAMDTKGDNVIKAFRHLLLWAYIVLAFNLWASSSGNIKVTKKLGVEMVMAILQEVCLELGATQHGLPFPFTSHCFRRGGAQYRFFEGPPERRWSSELVQVWGGWVGDEKPDTMLKYLINVRHQSEKDYSDALSPLRSNCEGEKRYDNIHQSNRPVTQAEYQQGMHQVQASLNCVINLLGNQYSTTPATATLPTNAYAVGLAQSGGISSPAQVAVSGLTGTIISINGHATAAPHGPLCAPLPNFQISGAGGALQPAITQPVLREYPPADQPCPTVPDLVKNPTRWYCAVKDWEAADPIRMLFLPLAARDDNWTNLLTEIRSADPRTKQRTSKKGTPEERVVLAG
ncbi:hypothetical protein FRC00_007184 [Tulasnella sp. 408]|nr:hypothetical protein FRC00_007184 [Tulasnella sp. 408]